MMNEWLPIADYSGKYRVSISTLRRRIKAGEIEYNFRDGKYLIRDEPLSKSILTQSAVVAPPQTNDRALLNQAKGEIDETVETEISLSNHLLAEIKKAYSLILQEKEEHIMLLREEMADLRTLVKVLESENDRLKKPTEFSWDTEEVELSR
jgi:hypothetical protein